MKELEELMKSKLQVLSFIFLIVIVFLVTSSAYSDTNSCDSNKKAKENSFKYIPSRSYNRTLEGTLPGVKHKRVKRWLHGRPAIINILTVDPKTSNTVVKPSFASYFLNNTKPVTHIVNFESAIAGVNACYFKPDYGVPLGTSILDGELITGPIFNRVALGITKDKNFMIDKVKISGEINIDNKEQLKLFNVNEPVFSNRMFTVFTDKWGMKTPRTSTRYSHLVVIDNVLASVKNSSVPIPKGGYVIVGPHRLLPKSLKVGNEISYKAQLTPGEWNNVQYAIGGGPYLIKDGKMFIDKQRFSRSFLWRKSPRTAVGYTKGGSLVIVTIDGRIRGVTEGASLSELAKIMYEQGCYQAMNLDGGTSTQMVYHGKIVNIPPVRGGSHVNNALVIIAAPPEKVGIFGDIHI